MTAEALNAEMQTEMGVPIDAPVIEGVPIDDSGSLADHEAKFTPDARPRDDGGRFQPQTGKRDRESTRATPEDVPKIQELTARAKAAEEALGIKQEPNESERVFNIRRRAEMAERLAKQTAAPAPAPVVAKAPAPKVAEFTEAEPKLDDFSDQSDPYAAWQRALARYDRRKDEFDAAKTQAVESHVSAIQEHRNAYGQRMSEHYQANPEAKAVIAAAPHAGINLPIAMEAAIVLSPRGAQFTEYLARNPDVFDEIYTLSSGKAPDAPLVAHIERMLTSRVQAGKTTAAAPRLSVTPAPRLPTVVKTTPQAPVSDGRPDDDAPLSEHEKFHYPQGARGRFRR